LRCIDRGLEFQVGVNHVGHFLLASLLTSKLVDSAPARVVCLSSSGHLRATDCAFIDHPKLETEPYDPWLAYGNAKFSNVLFAREFHRRYSAGGKGVSAFSVHPGGIFTGLQTDVAATTMFKWLVVAPFFFKSVAQGCCTTLYCALEPGIEGEGSGGLYFDNLAVGKQVKKTGYDKAKALWERTEAVIDACSKKGN